MLVFKKKSVEGVNWRVICVYMQRGPSEGGMAGELPPSRAHHLVSPHQKDQGVLYIPAACCSVSCQCFKMAFSLLFFFFFFLSRFSHLFFSWFFKGSPCGCLVLCHVVPRF